MMLDDFLGYIAGLYELLIFISLFIFGGYIDFSSKILWIQSLYDIEKNY